jgi:hypothetical protein
VVGRWWEQLLHNQSALRLKGRLLFQPGVMVTSVPWQLDSSALRVHRNGEHAAARRPAAAPDGATADGATADGATADGATAAGPDGAAPAAVPDAARRPVPKP